MQLFNYKLISDEAYLYVITSPLVNDILLMRRKRWPVTDFVSVRFERHF